MLDFCTVSKAGNQPAVIPAKETVQKNQYTAFLHRPVIPAKETVQQTPTHPLLRLLSQARVKKVLIKSRRVK